MLLMGASGMLGCIYTYEGNEMSPDRPKTPITAFRLDEETRQRLKRIGEQAGTTMTGAVRMLAESAEGARWAMRSLATELEPDAPPLVKFVRDRLVETEHQMFDEVLDINGDGTGLASQHPYHPLIKAIWQVTEAVSETDWAGYAVRDGVLERFAGIWKDHPDYQQEWAD